MILVTLGSQKFQFNRLLMEVDRLIENGTVTDEVFAQIGYSDYIPKNYGYKQFLDRDEFNEYIEKSDIVITHGGTGAIINGVKKGKKVIAVPRLAKYGEHVDDHQLQIVHRFGEGGYICRCEDTQTLGDKISKSINMIFNVFISNTEKYINDIDRYMGSF